MPNITEILALAAALSVLGSAMARAKPAMMLAESSASPYVPPTEHYPNQRQMLLGRKGPTQ